MVDYEGRTMALLSVVAAAKLLIYPWPPLLISEMALYNQAAVRGNLHVNHEMICVFGTFFIAPLGYKRLHQDHHRSRLRV